MKKIVGEWRKCHWWLVLIGFFFFALLLSLGFHYWFNAKKSFWDFLETFLTSAVLPISLAILGFVLQSLQKSQEVDKQKEREHVQHLQREHDENQAKEDALEVYFDRMADLVEDIRSMASGERSLETASLETTRAIIRARTLSVLRRLSEKDGRQKASVVQFLIGIAIVRGSLDLSDADLSNVILPGVDLHKLNLTRVDLRSADLSGSILSDVNLRESNLSQSKSSSSKLLRVNLIQAKLNGADLFCSRLTDAVLVSTDLVGATLTDAILTNAVLTSADLTSADLTGATLTGAILEGIKFDESTRWPDPSAVAKARNIPRELKKHLGIDDPNYRPKPALYPHL